MEEMERTQIEITFSIYHELKFDVNGKENCKANPMVCVNALIYARPAWKLWSVRRKEVRGQQ